MDKKPTHEYIDVLDLCSRFLRYLKIFWIPLLLPAFITTGIFGAAASRLQTRSYSSQLVFTYGVKTADATEFDFSLSGVSGIDMISNSIYGILKTDQFKEALLTELGKETLSTELHVSFTSHTNLGILYSNSLDRDEAVEALTATFKVLPELMRPIVGFIAFRTEGTPGEAEEHIGGFPVILLAAAGFIVGLFLGLGLLGLYVFVRRELQTEQAVTDALSLNVLGSLPFLKKKGSPSFINAVRLSVHLPGPFTKKEGELVLTPAYLERLRLIATQLIDELKNNHYHSLLIMSTKTGEGKTVFTNALRKELINAGWKVTLIHDFREFREFKSNPSDNELILIDYPGSVTSNPETMKTAALADASLLIIKSNAILPEDAKWGLHYHEDCRAKCVGAVLNACI